MALIADIKNLTDEDVVQLWSDSIWRRPLFGNAARQFEMNRSRQFWQPGRYPLPESFFNQPEDSKVSDNTESSLSCSHDVTKFQAEIVERMQKPMARVIRELLIEKSEQQLWAIRDGIDLPAVTNRYDIIDLIVKKIELVPWELKNGD